MSPEPEPSAPNSALVEGKGDPEAADPVAAQILDAASRRFLHYGYGKTTMSEIAADCNMSTGNLYRYFPSKLDIAESFVRRLSAEQELVLRKAVAADPGPPAETVRRLLQLILRLAYDRYHDRPKAFELAMQVMRERPDIAVAWEEGERAVLAEVIRAGEATGAFAEGEHRRAPRLIQDAVYRFTTPALFLEGDFEHLTAELDDLASFLLDALAWRRAADCRER